MDEKITEKMETPGSVELAKNTVQYPDHIIKQNTRILRPSEYLAFRDCLNPTQQILADVALNTGLVTSNYRS